ncbi:MULTISPECIES: nickel transporter permease [Peribacillus]|uniref:nickel transporter permease n=1 Tax=Peribacillus TaxID=2675229 RepID=UPI00203D49EE|nr:MULTISPECIES: nickel transporter permease [Peribacillus]MCM3675844.1 ABC transporter permease subunit [Peribacillus simplex]MDQ0880576.1 peptide/nickel transport system permease protein [Peribacillus sp. V2I11]
MKNVLHSLNRGVIVGASLLAIIFLIGLLAPWVSPHNPLDINLSNRLSSPSWEYPFGTDHLGRCVLSRIFFGIRISVVSAFGIMIFTLIISLPIGLLTGYLRGRTDHTFMRVIDGTLAIPDFVLTITIVGVLGPGFVNLIIAITMVRWANYVRLIRSLVIKVCEEDYLLSARMSGNSHLRILKRYVLPEIISSLVVFGALDMGKIVLLIAGLSFLGLGVQPPSPEWGVMLHDATSYFQIAPHVMIFPGLAILFFVTACQLISDRFNKTTISKEV